MGKECQTIEESERELIVKAIENPFYTLNVLSLLQMDRKKLFELLFDEDGGNKKLERGELKNKKKKPFSMEKMWEISKGMKKFIKKLTGVNIFKFQEEASIKVKNNDLDEDEKEEMKTEIYNLLNFLEGKNRKDQNLEIKRLGQEANKFIEEAAEKYCGGHDKLHLTEDVRITDDLVELLYLAGANKEDSKQIQFEAIRKFFLIIFLGRLQHKKMDEEMGDNLGAVKKMLDFLYKYFLPSGELRGETYKRYLCFDMEDGEITNINIQDAPEKGKMYKTLAMRKMVIKNLAGEARTIFYHLETREKFTESMLYKDLRFGEDIGVKTNDHNGIRFMFESLEDWRDFHRMFRENIMNQIEERLIKHIQFLDTKIKSKEAKKEDKDVYKEMLKAARYRLANLGESYIESEIKDTLEGGHFPGSSEASSGNLEVHKFKLEITGHLGQKIKYEIQGFLYKGYGKIKVQKGETAKEHEVKRFYESRDFPINIPLNLEYGLADLLFPEIIYPEFDQQERGKAKIISLEKAHQEAIADLKMAA